MSWLSSIASNVVLATLVAVAAWLVQRRLERPALARVLWALALVKLVTPPLVSVRLVEFPSAMACTLGVCGCAEHALLPPVVRGVLPWALLGVWSVGGAVTLAAAWRRWVRFRRLLTHASPAPKKWQSLASRLAAELSLRRTPEILVIPSCLPPLVVPGWRRARLLLPAGLIGRLNRSQCKALLVHELVHIKRGDHLMRILELAVSAAFWWLPLVGVIGRQLRACEEACCDAAVTTRLPRARRDYARLLLDVIDFTDPLPRRALPQVTAMSAAEGLERRLRAILNTRKVVQRAWPSAALAVAAACAVLPCGLGYSFSRQSAPVKVADGGKPNVDATSWAGCETPAQLPVFGCPKLHIR